MTARGKDENPKLSDVIKYAKKVNPNEKNRTIHTIQGWGSVLALVEAMKKAKTLDGPGILAAFESFKDVNLGLGIPPVSLDKRQSEFHHVQPLR